MNDRHVAFHGVALVVWIVLLVPSLFLWRDSVFWVVLMSWYAIVVSHQAALEAALAKRKIEEQAEENES
jgi:hypothetical protein